MAKGNTTVNDVLKCILKGTAPGYLANPNLYVSLHKTDPTVTGNQTTGEVTTYDTYTRRPISKATGWTDNGLNFTNAALIQFPICSAIGDTVNFVAIGSGDTGVAGQIYYIGALTVPLVITANIQPQFSIGNLQVTES